MSSNKPDFNLIEVGKKLWGLWNNEDQSVALSATFLTVSFAMWLFTDKLQIVYVIGLGFVFLGMTITKHVVDYHNRKMFLDEQRLLAANAKEKAEINKQMEIISSKHDIAEEAREIIIEEIIEYLDDAQNEEQHKYIDNGVLKLYARTLKRMKAHSFELTRDAKLPYKKFIDAYFKAESYEISIDDIPQILDLNLNEKDTEKLRQSIQDNNLENVTKKIEERTGQIQSTNRTAEEVNEQSAELLAKAEGKL